MKIALNIVHFLERAAKVYGHRPALIDPQAPADDPLRQITYQELWKLVQAQARAFSKLGVKPGGKIAVISDNSSRFFMTFFSVSGFGRILVPINYRLKKSEIDFTASVTVT